MLIQERAIGITRRNAFLYRLEDDLLLGVICVAEEGCGGFGLQFAVDLLDAVPQKRGLDAGIEHGPRDRAPGQARPIISVRAERAKQLKVRVLKRLELLKRLFRVGVGRVENQPGSNEILDHNRLFLKNIGVFKEPSIEYVVDRLSVEHNALIDG